jgi:hypothetical protein
MTRLEDLNRRFRYDLWANRACLKVLGAGAQACAFRPSPGPDRRDS